MADGQDGADVDVLLENRGTLVLGTSPGQTQGLDFQQNASGAWNVELGGTGINDYDRMTLSGLAQLGGALNLSLLAPYVPTLADPALTILSASSVAGTFASVTQPAGMPAGLRFNVVYNPANVQLVVASVLSGNRNFEGRIQQDVRANYLASPPLVVAYALAGSMNVNLTTDPLGPTYTPLTDFGPTLGVKVRNASRMAPSSYLRDSATSMPLG